MAKKRSRLARAQERVDEIERMLVELRVRNAQVEDELQVLGELIKGLERYKTLLLAHCESLQKIDGKDKPTEE